MSASASSSESTGIKSTPALTRCWRCWRLTRKWTGFLTTTGCPNWITTCGGQKDGSRPLSTANFYPTWLSTTPKASICPGKSAPKDPASTPAKPWKILNHPQGWTSTLIRKSTKLWKGRTTSREISSRPNSLNHPNPNSPIAYWYPAGRAGEIRGSARAWIHSNNNHSFTKGAAMRTALRWERNHPA